MQQNVRSAPFFHRICMWSNPSNTYFFASADQTRAFQLSMLDERAFPTSAPVVAESGTMVAAFLY